MSNYNDRNRRNPQKNAQSNRSPLIVLGIFALVLFSCIGGTALAGVSFFRSFFTDSQSTPATPAATALTWAPDSAELTIAVSPLMAPVLQALADTFNNQQSQTADGQTKLVTIVSMEPEKMVEAALTQPNFQALSPDSTLWLDRLETRWAAQAVNETVSEIPLGQHRTSESVRYAVSPIVIAMPG